LWTDGNENAPDGTLSYEKVKYIGIATLLIPERGTYTLEPPGTGVEIRVNDQLFDRACSRAIGIKRSNPSQSPPLARRGEKAGTCRCPNQGAERRTG
jgi:hypothetical protein